MAQKKPTKAQIEQARKRAEASLTTEREAAGSIVGLTEDWRGSYIPSDLGPERKAGLRRKLRNKGFSPASEMGLDDIAVSGDNDAEIWVMPADVFDETLWAAREARVGTYRESAAHLRNPPTPRGSARR